MVISFSAHGQQGDSIKIHQRDSLATLQEQETKWSKVDSANHKANSKIDSAQSLLNNALKPDMKKLAMKLGDNRRKKRAEKKKADTLNIPSDSLNTQAGKTKNNESIKNDSTRSTTSPKEITRKVEHISSFPDKVTSDVLNTDVHKIAERLKQKRAQRIADREKADTTKVNQYNTDSLRTDESKQTDTVSIAHRSLPKYKSLDSLSQRESSDAAQQIKSAESKITDTENKAEQTIDDVNKKLNAPIGHVNKKTNAAMSKLSDEAMGKSDLPSNVTLPGINSSRANSLTSPVTQDLDLPVSGMDNPIAGKIDSPENLLKDKQSDLNVDKMKGDIENPMNDKKEEGNKLKQKLDEKVKEKMKGVTDSRQVTEIKDQTTKVNAATDKVQGYSKDIENIKKGDIDKVDELKKEAMNTLPAKEFSTGQEQLKAMDQEMEKMKALKNKEAFKKQTMANAREEVVKQLSTQQSKMMQTVDKISAYQKQGGALAGMVKGLPARPVKSRRPPLIERFVPGITLQVQKGKMWLIDVNPTLRFRVRSILSTGLGYNYRFAIDKSGKYKSEEHIAGLRSFTEFSIRKGLSIRADVERMSAYVPLIYAQPDVKERKWVWSYMIGLRKDFGLGAGVLGNVQFMYNIYDPKKESPYLNRLNVRFDFEFPLKKKKAKNNSSLK